jgi:hypothetical protein
VDQKPDPGYPDDAVVVRGGEMRVSDLEASFESFYDLHHDPTTGACKAGTPHLCYAISVNCIPGLSAHETAVRANRPNPRMRASSVARIRNAQFALYPTPDSDEGHCALFFPDENGMALRPNPVELFALALAFDEPEANPARR